MPALDQLRNLLFSGWLVAGMQDHAVDGKPSADHFHIPGVLAVLSIAGFAPAPIDAYIVYLAWSFQRKLHDQQKVGIWMDGCTLASKAMHLVSSMVHLVCRLISLAG
jgi:hypothetical protein